jgi:integrase/recombinase XerC
MAKKAVRIPLNLESTAAESRISCSQESRATTARLMPLVTSYLTYYAVGNTHTARAKQLDIQHFLQFLTRYQGVSKADKLSIDDWNHTTTQQFVEESLHRGEAPTTVARRLATLKHMGRTLAERLSGFTNPARDIKTPKIPTAQPLSLSRAEIEKIRERARLRVSDRATFIRYRNRVLFELLLDTGLRADEVRLLRISQIDQDFEWIKNVRTKGRRYRNVYISSTMRPVLKMYLERRAGELKRFFAHLNRSIDRTLPVFISSYNCDPLKPESFLLGAKTVWRAVHELSTHTELHPHLLRHCFAVELLNHSKDIRLVSQALGHSDVRTTMRYTERNDAIVAEALEALRKSVP